MEPFLDWIDHLNISAEQLASWKEQAPEDVPLLVWVLREGKVPFEAYATWAKNHYGLPVLKHDFFSQSRPVSIEASEWSPWMIPVAQWEELTYVGCVMPPSHPEEGFVYLLADPKDLAQRYELMEQPSSTGSGLPDGFILNLPSVPSMPPIPSAEEETAEEEISESPTVLGEFPNLTATPSEENSPEEIQTKAQPEDSKLDLSEWWSICSKQFAHAVLLQAGDSHFTPVWRNGEDFQGPSLAAESPSLFRIALRTKKPYHGFVVENQIHSEFFKSLDLEGYPSSVTALNIPSGDQTWILTLYGHLGQASNELKEAEELCQKILPALSGNGSSKSEPKAA